MIKNLKNEIIHGRTCTFKKYSNGYVVGRCRGYMVGGYKTKKETIAYLKKSLED